MRIPITNVYGGGDYTAVILVGSQKKPANVILDTGSSTLAVKPQVYNPSQDAQVAKTSLAQIVLYGTGGWAGPLLDTDVTLGGVGLPQAPIALTAVQEKDNFGQADGILGLAYNALNDAYDLSTELQKKGVNPPDTYPWPLKIAGTQAALTAFEQSLPVSLQTTVDPYFTALEGQSIVANKLAFYTLRSFPRISDANAPLATLAQDKLNQGFLIVGGGEEQTDLYTGVFQAVSVVDDLYYNVNLKSVQVGNEPAVAAAPLQAQFAQDAGSNAIVDSGTNSLSVAADVYQAIVNAIEKINPKFAQQIRTAGQSNNGIPAAQLALAQWPSIAFVLQGATGDVKLTVTPSTYWQTDFPAPGQAFFVIFGQPAGPNQSIFGLPLLNNYYTVFDRSVDARGVIQFASINPAA